MLKPDQKLALYMQDTLTGVYAKMGYGILRYAPNPVVCVIDDSEHIGKDIATITHIPRSAPIVGNVKQAIKCGAEVFVLGTNPLGGKISQAWFDVIDEAVHSGLSVLNGMHDLLAPRYPKLKENQWVWDVRMEPAGLSSGMARASRLKNNRILTVGTDMAVGKKTTGLELYQYAKNQGVKAGFVATGQGGVTIMGSGIPLDAIRVDYASGAVEREVLSMQELDFIVIEGQGSLLHPGSTATLPLMRGSQATHLILCHRAGQEALITVPEIKIPPLKDFIALLETVASVCGTFGNPKVVAVSLNTEYLASELEAQSACQKIETMLGLPCTDPLRFGSQKLFNAIS